MDKLPKVIEGDYRVVSKNGKEPFWGKNAGVLNTLHALTLGFTIIGHDKQTASESPKWYGRLLFFLVIALIAFGRLWINS